MEYKYLKLKYKKSFYTNSIEDMKRESANELKQLKDGVPLHKVLGYIEMTDLIINLQKDVLIPRYETEELIYIAKEYIKSNSRVLDLCTGSGYIGLAIKKITDADVVASDISPDAIEQAKINAKINQLDINIIKSDLFENIEGKFDVIISNPPYIPNGNKLDSSVLNFEPHLALFGGEDGNDIYRKIVEQSDDFLSDGGILLFEISIDNVEYLESQQFTILKDINGKPRMAFRKKSLS